MQVYHHQDTVAAILSIIEMFSSLEFNKNRFASSCHTIARAGDTEHSHTHLLHYFFERDYITKCVKNHPCTIRSMLYFLF